MNISPIYAQSYYFKNTYNTTKPNSLSFEGNLIKKTPLNKYKVHSSKLEDHKDFMFKSKLFKDYQYGLGNGWMEFMGSDGRKCPWKMHVYSDNEHDFQKLLTALVPYFKDNDVHWKTAGPYMSIDYLNKDDRQKGKAITIYPHNNEEFKQIAYDLNYIIKNNEMQLKDSSIHFDRKLGDSGRLFYRYDYNSGKYKDLTLNLMLGSGLDKLREIYRSTKTGYGYLADDMSITDDPFFTFNPDTKSENCGTLPYYRNI